MSVYKYMAGIVPEDTTKGDADDYDPHDHRKIANPTTYLDTMTHMLKGSIGAGILAMPYATSKLGIFASAITLIVVGIIATYCIHVLIAAQYLICKRHRRGYMAYPKSMLFAFREGPPMLRWAARPLYYSVDVMLIVWQLGICTIYLVFCAENIKQIAQHFGTTLSLRLILVILLLPTILLNLIRDLKMLSPLSSISNGVTLLGLMLVAYYLLEDDIQFSKDMLKLKSWAEIPNFIGTALFALEAVGVILALEYNMAHPKQFVGFFGLFNLGMVFIVFLYTAMGTFGYLRFGDAIQASITLNLPLHDKKAIVSKICFIIAIFLSFPLQNFVAYNITWNKIKKKLKSKIKLVDYIIRVAMVVIPWILAVAVPKLGPFIALFGALCLSLLAIIFPVIMNMCVWYAQPTGYGRGKFRLIRDMLILMAGLVIGVSGVTSSVADIINDSGGH